MWNMLYRKRRETEHRVSVMYVPSIADGEIHSGNRSHGPQDDDDDVDDDGVSYLFQWRRSLALGHFSEA